MILSPDGLTTITADTNDQIDFEVGSIDRARLLLDSNGIGQLQVRDLDNTALAGPSLRLLRDSNSPAADDEIGEIQFVGKDADGNEETYARIRTQIVNATNAAEDGKITAEALLAGVSTNVLTLDPANNAGLLKGSRPTVFTADGTYTPPDDLRFVIVEVLGGGGAGGGAPATSVLGEAGCGSGGGAGGYARVQLAAGDIPGNATITVGAGGAGVSADEGGDGGTSSWADGSNTISATGGAGGDFLPVSSDTIQQQPGGAGGQGSGGDFNIRGEPGHACLRHDDGRAHGSAGGSSRYGGGGSGSGGSSGTDSQPGDAGQGNGAGGGGALNTGEGGSAQAGGDGAVGIVIVHEYV